MGEDKNMLLKGAMTYGLTMGIYWVIKYIFFIFSINIPVLNYVYLLLTFAVPFIAYYLTKKYREEIGGQISFFHAWRFGTMMYFFAALIVSLEHFIFYQFIAPPNFLPDVINQTLNTLKDTNIDTEIIESVGNMNFTPIHMAIQGIFNNIFYGIILSIPVAAILCKNNASGTIIQKSENE
ncbi:DUF4199 domain-containing protein [Parabacteroides bouchesdurhonensis]|uniref:DUF4199 domain-containing protein n=1 Tax=Parabacteroides bouchesdurhonensis TaxID=1936995 RepID=UPI000C855B4B|nr:DUF4199 domain-containing protein [Parabacteroides bouchesdurhonensis]RHJ92569.1 DUF4199 domain-containing protein [Bacteroides sp. AM07-16]